MANLGDEVFMAYTTYSVIVIVKMMLMSLMTAYFRVTRGVSINEFISKHVSFITLTFIF